VGVGNGKAATPVTLSDSNLDQPGDGDGSYSLDEQIGFILRQAYQRHCVIFTGAFGDVLTPTQWAVIAKLAEIGRCSQNLLGRQTAMDVATVKGVIERLVRNGYVATDADLSDRRRLIVSLTEVGRALYERKVASAAEVSGETLLPLKANERAMLLRLLKRLR
jgi:MarR family transcriptional regulator, lower aerobic nicotinate degradation pathway regulator